MADATRSLSNDSVSEHTPHSKRNKTLHHTPKTHIGTPILGFPVLVNLQLKSMKQQIPMADHASICPATGIELALLASIRPSLHRVLERSLPDKLRIDRMDNVQGNQRRLGGLPVSQATRSCTQLLCQRRQRPQPAKCYTQLVTCWEWLPRRVVPHTLGRPPDLGR